MKAYFKILSILIVLSQVTEVKAQQRGSRAATQQQPQPEQCTAYKCRNMRLTSSREYQSVKILQEWTPAIINRTQQTNVSFKTTTAKISEVSFEGSMGVEAKSTIWAGLKAIISNKFVSETALEISTEPFVIKAGEQARWVQFETAQIYQFDYFDPNTQSWKTSKCAVIVPQTRWEIKRI